MASTDLPSSTPPNASAHPYDRLRLMIRVTGMLLMFAGTIYFIVVVGTLLFGQLSYDKPTDGIYVLVVSLLAAGLGLLAFRVGLKMLRAITPGTISSFSFVFALVYTPVLMQLLPASILFAGHPVLAMLFPLVYLGLTYLILKQILLQLLMPKT